MTKLFSSQTEFSLEVEANVNSFKKMGGLPTYPKAFGNSEGDLYVICRLHVGWPVAHSIDWNRVHGLHSRVKGLLDLIIELWRNFTQNDPRRSRQSSTAERGSRYETIREQERKLKNFGNETAKERLLNEKLHEQLQLLISKSECSNWSKRFEISKSSEHWARPWSEATWMF